MTVAFYWTADIRKIENKKYVHWIMYLLVYNADVQPLVLLHILQLLTITSFVAMMFRTHRRMQANQVIVQTPLKW